MGDTNLHDDGSDRQTDQVASQAVETSRRSFLTAVGTGVAVTAAGLDGSETASRVVAAEGETATSVSQYGITWEFKDERPVGQYANGDWWVEGPVTITKITPESTEVDGRVMHGTMLNPVGSTQGYDSFDTDVSYDPTLNVDPGTTGEDLTVEEASVVSSISLESPDSSGRPMLSDLAILTVVTEKPPEDAFRPDPYRESKQHQWQESEFDDSMLRELPITDTIADHLPDIAEARRESLRFWNDQDTGWTQRPLHAERNQPTYHTNVGRRSGAMGLLLHLDINEDIKRDLLVGFVQHGLDVHARLQLEPDYASGQKIKTGRKLKLVLAAVGFDDEELYSTADREEDRARFQEDADTFFVSDADIGKEVENGHETYREPDLGMPEWGGDHWRDGTGDDRTWETSYRYEGSAFVPTVLTARLAQGARNAWNHPALFAYTDRYEYIGWDSPYPIQAFAQACWDEYRYVDREPIDETVTVAPDGAAQFSPADVEVEPGTTVGFEWDSGAHTVTVATQPDDADWSGVTDRAFAGATHHYTFEIEGTYEYYSQPNRGEMQGRITVRAPSDSSEEPLSIPEAIDSDDDGEIDDQEILNVVDYWHDNEIVPGTDGQTIDQETLLELITRWQRGGS